MSEQQQPTTVESNQDWTLGQAASAFESLLSPPEASSEPDATPEPPAPQADAEPDPEEPEQSADADGEPDEAEESDESAAIEPRTYRVKVDGEEVEVTEDELLKGYQRHADYTRKTQQTAEERRKLDAELRPELDAVRAERQRYATYLKQLEDALTPPEAPDWTQLRQQLPAAEFAATWAEWQQRDQQLKAVQAERQQAEAKVAQDRVEQHRTLLAAERAKLVEAIPEWQDPAKASAERDALTTYARTLGFSDAELGAVVDHRALILLRKAMLYDQAARPKGQRPATVQPTSPPKVRVAAPGTRGAVRPPVTDATKAKQRLAKTGRVADAAAVFEQFLPD